MTVRNNFRMPLTLEQARRAKPLDNRILLLLPQLLPESIGSGLTGADGRPVRLLLDASFRPEDNRCIVGRCVVPAARLTRTQPLFARPTPSNPNKVVWLDDCVNEVVAGDEVYCDYSGLEPDYEVAPGLYAVPYNLLIAVMRKGKPRPIGGYVLLSDVHGYEVVDGHHGRNIPVHEVVRNLGRVAHLGTPLRRTAVLDPVEFGQLVHFQEGYSFPNTINGQRYYCVRHDYLLGALFPVPSVFPLTSPAFMDLSLLRVQGNRLLVKPADAATQTPGGFQIPEASQGKAQVGTVLGVGPGSLCDNGQLVPLGIDKGDTVHYPRHAGTEVEIDGEKLLYIRATEVYAAM